MLDIRKWNYNTQEYDHYDLPNDVKIVLMSNDMDEQINCAACFKLTTYGVCFTSKVLHTGIGFGYPVCEDCYRIELEEERSASH